jgi:hypothetical protein
MEKALQRRAVLGHSNATLQPGRHPSCVDLKGSIRILGQKPPPKTSRVARKPLRPPSGGLSPRPRATPNSGRKVLTKPVNVARLLAALRETLADSD